MNAVVRSALARIASFLPTALATLFTSRLIVEHYGVAAFDSFALVLSLINLVPLNDLGAGAAVTAAYADAGTTRERATATVLTAARVLAVSTVATIVVAAGIGAGGWWPTLLGPASGPNAWCALAVVIYALTYLPGLGQSLLLGVHRNHVTVVLQTFYTPLIAAMVGIGIALRSSGAVMMILPCAALVIVHGVTSVVASRVTGLSWLHVLRALPRRRRYPGASIRALTGPVLIITLATPVALQSDRIVLSHVSSSQAVAQYSIAFQVFGPALALIAAAAQPLWPMYTAARSQGRRGPDIGRILLLFGGAGVALGGVLALLAEPVAEVVAGGRVHIHPLLALSGALAVVTAALSYPVAMSLMDPVGIRVVVGCTLVGLPLNIGLSILLADRLGAPGPLLASCAVGILVQAVPALIVSHDLQNAGRHRAGRGRVVATPGPLAEPAVAGWPTPLYDVPEGAEVLEPTGVGQGRRRSQSDDGGLGSSRTGR